MGDGGVGRRLTGLDRLLACAADYSAKIVNRRLEAASVSFELIGASSSALFELDFEGRGDLVEVRETTPGKALPKSCPTRHINDDGTFCVGFHNAENLRVSDDPASVTAWWKRLTNYLRLQKNADRLGRWPREAGWAHGDAAVAQAEAEGLAQKLGEGFLADLTASRVSVRYVKSTRAAQLTRNGELVASMRPELGRIRNLRGPCICDQHGRRLTRRACGDHSIVTARLIAALLEMREREGRFIRERLARGFKCCGTMKDCPFRTANDSA